MQTSIRLMVSSSYPAVTDLQTADAPLAYNKAFAMADGFGVNQADRLFADTRTLAPSANEDLDLAGVLTDVYGRVLTFVKIKGIIIVADKANTNDVQIRRGATNGVPVFTAVSAGVDLNPGGIFVWFSPSTGKVVTPATGDLINIANSAAGTSVNYDVVFIGTSA
jgi:hypothetical protein